VDLGLAVDWLGKAAEAGDAQAETLLKLALKAPEPEPAQDEED
jgi:TPR repeat protein